MNAISLPYRLGVQQRVLPAYRAPFFDLLAGACRGGLAVFAGEPRPGEGIQPADELAVARYCRARNLHLAGIYWQRGLLRWLEEWQPDALITEANPRNRSLPGAVDWMHARRRPVIGWGLGVPAAGLRLAGLRAAGRERLLASFDAVIAYSRRGAEEYVAAGVPAARVFVAPNAVTPRPDSPPPARPARPGEAPLVLFVGRLQARKRVDHLLRACAALPEALQPRLRIVGDGPARAECEALARAIYPRAEFTGALHGPALEACFAQADLFVLPGTGGLALQQAMAHGLPVIAAEADGTQADLVRPENGWQIPAGELEALITALRAALEDVAGLRARGARSYRIVAEEVNLEAMVAAFARAVEAAAAARSARG